VSGLIKSADAAARVFLRPLIDAPAPAAVAPIDPELLALRQLAEEQLLGLAERDAEIARLRDALAAASEAGRAEGRKAALDEATKLNARTLAVLQPAVQAALDRFAAALGSLDRLAALLARESLAIMIGEPGERAELLARMVALQVEAIEAAAILRIDVARTDFADPDTLAALAGGTACEIRATDDLKSGDCTITLRLGALEIGIDQQWGRIADLLGTLAEPA
jgi:flagellar biosynthesis/type III secretory pathway protein FliH